MSSPDTNNSTTVDAPDSDDQPVVNPSQLDMPAYLMSAPFRYTTDIANNIWMSELAEADRAVDPEAAFSQWMALYSYLTASGALVYLLPTPDEPLQDLVFTANLAIILNNSQALVSNYSSPPRIGEAIHGKRLLQAMGYDTTISPHPWEGEADLKHLYDNTYIGGYGQRSSRDTYTWIETTWPDTTIIKVAMTDEHLYHLDCTIFPLTSDETLVCTELYEEEELNNIAEATDIIDVTVETAYSGITNSVRLHNTILNASHIHDLVAGTDEYNEELAKNRALDDIASKYGFEVTYINLSEYAKAGALLSCLAMHLNRYSYTIDLI